MLVDEEQAHEAQLEREAQAARVAKAKQEAKAKDNWARWSTTSTDWRPREQYQAAAEQRHQAKAEIAMAQLQARLRHCKAEEAWQRWADHMDALSSENVVLMGRAGA